MVNSTGNEEFDRPDVVRKVVNSRLEHYSTKFWIKDEKKIRQTGKAMSFEDLLDELQKWMVVLINRGANEKHEQSNSNSSNGNNNINGGKQSARINATSSRGKGAPKQPSQQAQQPETMAQHIMNSPQQQQPTIRCSICESLHDTNDCQLLANLSIDERLQRLGQKGLCFHCFHRGHTARNCTQKPRCKSCNRLHNTLMCQRGSEYRNGMQNQIPFQSTPQNFQSAQNAATSAQNAAPSTQNNHAAAPPPHGPPVQPSAPAAATHPII